MSENQVRRCWEERVISTEKGNRVVHYYLMDATANCLLAVVGRERSLRHMTYSVTEDFLTVFGSSSSAHAGTRWQSRKEVSKFLQSVTSRGGSLFADSSQRIFDTTPYLKHLMSLMTPFSGHRNPMDDKSQGSRQSVAKNSDIMWSGDAWICNERLKHYPCFSRSGINIPVYSFVRINDEDKQDRLGYVEDFYEDQQGEKKVRVRQFLLREEIEPRFRNASFKSREVFITSTEKDKFAKDICCLAAILTPSDFKKCNDLLPQGLSYRTFVCHREFKDNIFSGFSLSKLRGYSKQPILACLKFHVPWLSNNRQNPTEAGGHAGQDPPTQGSKRNESLSLGPKTSFNDNLVAPIRQRLKIKLSKRRLADNKVVVSETQNQSLSKNNLMAGENKFFTVKRKDIRMSKDWIDNKWVDIKAKPDILSILTSFLNPPLQLPPLPPLAELQAKMKVPSSSKDGGSQDAKLLQVPSSSTSSGNKKAVEDLHLEQLLLIKKNEDWSRKSSGKDENDGKKAKTAMDTSGQPTNVKH
ncbi:hypothetical protein CDL12_08719 [Handroanthus impetiginosus]|uniref:BAH domain-containing protein n=1 Tax=Handroanthus impetiginosus TaxID=429701 RepID=A0A2G9HM59_9LAMI|nr:hypothetical protein CDL12_08719 [Handroanthus impetiginosus]